jgi:prepilin-type N-terminal cleavage/methylation domain-containing protein
MRDSKGFTLIEILVVMGIIALITAISMPSLLSYFQVSLNSASRELASSINEAYNASVITGRVYRLAYQFKDNTYWVESGPAQALLDTAATRERAERKKKLLSLSQFKDEKKDEEKDSKFKLDKTITRSKLKLPSGVEFEDIMHQQGAQELIKEGIAYTHFFPSGMSERTIIHLKDRSDHRSSLVISATLGVTDLYDRRVEGAEAFAE